VPTCLSLSVHAAIITLVYSTHDPTEVAIKKMIEASQRRIDVNSQVGGEAREEGWELILL
jgi:pyrimidine deaminase RibD-like protein